jgi:prefoldin subunit 5
LQRVRDEQALHVAQREFHEHDMNNQLNSYKGEVESLRIELGELRERHRALSAKLPEG